MLGDYIAAKPLFLLPTRVLKENINSYVLVNGREHSEPETET